LSSKAKLNLASFDQKKSAIIGNRTTGTQFFRLYPATEIVPTSLTVISTRSLSSRA